jgi:hypothetical protein
MPAPTTHTQTTQGATPVTTTATDKPVMDLTAKDSPTQVAEAPHLDQPVHPRPWTKASRAVVGLAATTSALAAAVLAVAAFGSDGKDTSVNRVAGNLPQIQESSQPQAVQTELDVRGIPTWWSREGVPVEHDDASDQPQAVQIELDVRGIPTWWSREGVPV